MYANNASREQAIQNARLYVSQLPGHYSAYMNILIEQESRWNPDANSGTGAAGIGQFTRATWNDTIKHLRANPDAVPIPQGMTIDQIADYDTAKHLPLAGTIITLGNVRRLEASALKTVNAGRAKSGQDDAGSLIEAFGNDPRQWATLMSVGHKDGASRMKLFVDDTGRYNPTEAIDFYRPRHQAAQQEAANIRAQAQAAESSGAAGQAAKLYKQARDIANSDANGHVFGHADRIATEVGKAFNQGPLPHTQEQTQAMYDLRIPTHTDANPTVSGFANRLRTGVGVTEQLGDVPQNVIDSQPAVDPRTGLRFGVPTDFNFQEDAPTIQRGFQPVVGQPTEVPIAEATPTLDPVPEQPAFGPQAVPIAEPIVGTPTIPEATREAQTVVDAARENNELLNREQIEAAQAADIGFLSPEAQAIMNLVADAEEGERPPPRAPQQQAPQREPLPDTRTDLMVAADEAAALAAAVPTSANIVQAELAAEAAAADPASVAAAAQIVAAEAGEVNDPPSDTSGLPPRPFTGFGAGVDPEGEFALEDLQAEQEAERQRSQEGRDALGPLADLGDAGFNSSRRSIFGLGPADPDFRFEQQRAQLEDAARAAETADVINTFASLAQGAIPEISLGADRESLNAIFPEASDPAPFNAGAPVRSNFGAFANDSFNVDIPGVKNLNATSDAVSRLTSGATRRKAEAVALGQLEVSDPFAFQQVAFQKSQGVDPFASFAENADLLQLIGAQEANVRDRNNLIAAVDAVQNPYERGALERSGRLGEIIREINASRLGVLRDGFLFGDR